MSAIASPFPSYEEVTAVPPARRAQDIAVSNLSVPFLIVIAVVVSTFTAAISASGVYWLMRLNQSEAQSQMQADIRSIREGMAAQRQIDDANKRADAAENDSQKQSYESTKQAVDSMRGVVQLLQLQVAELIKRRP